jgi:hypothetical protein
MTDLIWIGNTLYPRWLVFLVIGVATVVVVVVPALIAAAAEEAGLRRSRDIKNPNRKDNPDA